VFSSLADAILVSGSIIGQPADQSDLRKVREAITTVPVFANIGVSIDNVAEVLSLADGVIIGTHLKIDGNTWNAVDVHPFSAGIEHRPRFTGPASRWRAMPARQRGGDVRWRHALASTSPPSAGRAARKCGAMIELSLKLCSTTFSRRNITSGWLGRAVELMAAADAAPVQKSKRSHGTEDTFLTKGAARNRLLRHDRCVDEALTRIC